MLSLVEIDFQESLKLMEMVRNGAANTSEFDGRFGMGDERGS
jgi:hypothetical protein